MKFLNTIYKSEKGNVFTFLLGGIAIVGVLSFGGYQLLSGPLTSAQKVSQTNIAKNQLVMVSQIVIMDAPNQIGGGDCDVDGFIEPRAYRMHSGVAPAGGGLVPIETGAPLLDPWGVEFGYCAWDVGALSAHPWCGGGTNRLDGSDKPLNSPSETSLAFAIVSAGPDKTFQTTCNAYVDDSTGLITTSGDDLVKSFTYQQAAMAGASMWSLKASAMNTAETAKNLEVGSDIALDTSAGSIQATSLSTTGKIVAEGGLLLGDQTTVTACAAGDAGTLRYNTSSDDVEFCNGSGTWLSAGFTVSWPLLGPNGTSGAPSYSFENATNSGLFYDGTDTVKLIAPAGKEARLKRNTTTIVASDTTLDITSQGTANLTAGTSSAITFGRNGNTDFRLVADGGLQLGDTSAACDGTTDGTIKYISGSGFKVCDGTSWLDFPPIPVGCAPTGLAFTDQTGVAVDSFITSNTVTIAGLSEPCVVVAQFEYGGSIIKNSTDTGEVFVTIDNGDTIALRAKSHPTTSATATTGLYSGMNNFIEDWVITTVPCAAGSGSQSYTTPGTYTYTPPASLIGCTFQITVKGGGGGSNQNVSPYPDASRGGGMQFDWHMYGTAASFDILVGGGGGTNGVGGYGGGGNGGTGVTNTYGGGGASALKYDGTLIAVAGGGGSNTRDSYQYDDAGHGAPYGASFILQGATGHNPPYSSDARGGGPNGEGGAGASIGSYIGGDGGTSTIGTAQNGSTGQNTNPGTGGTAVPSFSVSGGGGGAGFGSTSSRGSGGGGGFGGGGGGGWAYQVAGGGGGYLKMSGSYATLPGYIAVHGGMRGNSTISSGGNGSVVISWD